MVLNIPTNPEYVITEINGLEVRMSYQGPNEGTVFPVTFYPSRGTEKTVTTVLSSGNDGEYDVGTSSMVVNEIGLEPGMLVSGPGISTNTVVVLVDAADGTYLELSKDTTYSSGELTFTNSGQSSFELSDITVSNIPDTCTNKVFTIKIYDNESSEPLQVTNWGMGGDNSVQVWWANGYQSGDRDPTDANEAVVAFPWSDYVFGDWNSSAYNNGYAIETNNNSSIAPGAFKVNLPITVDASRVYKITVETQDDSDSLNVNDGGYGFYDWWWD
ncbi:unannotated protein [freshwater metagenome]|uniref:Unannotated protein n=1 Tax=freshwater metagenome TaxID=449393 RepID=A0A6J6BR98_9ZZZZ